VWAGVSPGRSCYILFKPQSNLLSWGLRLSRIIQLANLTLERLHSRSPCQQGTELIALKKSGFYFSSMSSAVFVSLINTPSDASNC
jgi:hypothetical protein